MNLNAMRKSKSLFSFERRKFYCSVAAGVDVRGTGTTKRLSLQKWTAYWKTLLGDYKDVLVDSGKYAKEHPFKSSSWFSVFGFCLACGALNPDENDYKESVIRKSNELIFIAKPIRNPQVEEYLRSIEVSFNAEQIYRVSFGVFSLILLDHKNKFVSSFKDNCSYLQPTYYEILRNHVLDVGFWNKWWILDKKTADCDINPNEWTFN